MTRALQCFAAICIFIENGIFGAPPPPHLQAQFPLHEPLVDASSGKTQSQRPVTLAAPSLPQALRVTATANGVSDEGAGTGGISSGPHDGDSRGRRGGSGR